jgi:uncharacterized protein (TIGR00290 family)
MSWSSGKDSTLALHVARTEQALDIDTLLVTMHAEVERVSMHAVRRALLEAQADRLGLALHVVEIPPNCTNDHYLKRMSTAIDAAWAAGVEHLVFGDLFLEDVRAYREAQLADTGIAPVFPLWGRPTDQLALEMLRAGVKAVITCVDPAVLPGEFVGRAFDESLLDDLPDEVDPCGERGEFHTFVWDGPGFRSPIDIERGEVVVRDGFVFQDLVAVAAPERAV